MFLLKTMNTQEIFPGCLLTVSEAALVPSDGEIVGLWRAMPEPHRCMGVEVRRRQMSYGTGYRFAGDGGARPSVPIEDAPAYVRRCVGYAQRLAPGWKFDLAHANWYEGGSASISRHQDNEPGLVPGAPIFSFTVLLPGSVPRVFRISCSKTGPNILDVIPNNGDVIIMHGPDFQQKLWHEVPKTTAKAAKTSCRVNVTVRATRHSALRAGASE